MQVINIPPFAPVLMEATRALGYSLETAIADIIDNSVAAKASEIDLFFFPIENPYIAIFDNGFGMNKDELVNAMRYGSSNPNNERDKSDLGRFGLGLKTASMSQCKKLTVISKRNNQIIGAQWDLDYISHQTHEWSLKIMDGEELNDFPHFHKLLEVNSGTLVIWEELDRLMAGQLNFETSMSKQMDKVREHLSLVFHRYLKGESDLKKIQIKINNSILEPTDPFLSEKSTRIMADETINIQGKKVLVRPYILPHLSKLSKDEINVLGGEEGIRKQQGFYVYRNKRLLVWGTWFKMMRQGDLSKLARIQIDIPNSLDSLWTLDIKKSRAIPPEVVRRNISAIIKRVGESSKRTWTYRGREETDDTKVKIWKRLKTRNGGLSYEINRDHPLVNSINSISVNDKRLLERLLKQIERGLPINQLYVDLTNDEQITNESDYSKQELINLLNDLLSGCRNEGERKEMLERLMITDPFFHYPELIDEVFQEAQDKC